MDERMTRAAVAAILLALAGANHAQGLSDPMRPPGPGGAMQPDGAAAAAPRLQSVLLSKSRKMAVIDGQAVSLGGKVGDATVVAISETAVTLKRGDETEMLTLFPGVEKTLVRRGTAARATGNVAGDKGAK